MDLSVIFVRKTFTTNKTIGFRRAGFFFIKRKSPFGARKSFSCGFIDIIVFSVVVLNLIYSVYSIVINLYQFSYYWREVFAVKPPKIFVQFYWIRKDQHFFSCSINVLMFRDCLKCQILGMKIRFKLILNV